MSTILMFMKMDPNTVGANCAAKSKLSMILATVKAPLDHPLFYPRNLCFGCKAAP